ncbi:GNAT family N-acetyltransferase [Roseibium algae]|uniref:GNAT family N-acetyltransferase n=1 Tax=Roseibium algae TaxID=3123038 RepID=A0ABU8THB7_9HYPH
MVRSVELLLGGPATGRQLFDLAEAAYEERCLSFNEEQRDTFRTLLIDAAMGRAYLVRYRGESAGFVTVFYRYSVYEGGRTAQLEDMFLHPKFRGLGLGQRIIRSVLHDLEAFGLFSVQAVLHDRSDLTRLLEQEHFYLLKVTCCRKALRYQDDEN